MLEGRWAIYNRFPLLLKPWVPGVRVNNYFDKIPIWIQLPELELDLWSTGNLSKVASYVRVPIATDACTVARTRLSFARVMVEVPLGGVLPDSIPMYDDNGVLYHQKVVYEWKPVQCSKCGWFGHDSASCRKDKGKVVENLKVVLETS